MTCAISVRRCAGARSLRAAAVVCACGLAQGAMAAWNPAAGVKNGPEAASEPALRYIGPQLQVFGGSLDFLGSATINGPVSLIEQNGWGDPIVTTAGPFIMNGTTFFAGDGAKLTAGDGSGVVSTSGETLITNTSKVLIGHMSAGETVRVVNPGSYLQLVGDFEQTAGSFLIEDAALFHADGAFNIVGNSFVVHQGSTFSIGNPAASSIALGGEMLLAEGAQVMVGALTAANTVRVVNPRSSLHVIGDFVQSGGNFVVEDQAEFLADGAFTMEGNSLIVHQGSTFGVGDPGASSIDITGEIFLANGAHVSVGGVSAGSHVRVVNPGSELQIAGDCTQTGGNFAIEDGAAFHAGGSLTMSGHNFVVHQGSTFGVGEPEASSIDITGEIFLANGAQVSVGGASAGNHVRVVNPGSELHITGDFAQTGGDFAVEDGADFAVGGIFEMQGNHFVVHQGSTFSVGDPASSSISLTGEVFLANGAQVVVASVSAGNSVRAVNPGTTLHVLGDVTQSGGNFAIEDGGAFQADGALTMSGDNFIVHQGSTFSVGDPGSSSVSLTGEVFLANGAQVLVASLTAGNSVRAVNPGTSLHILGDVTQSGGNFAIEDGAEFHSGGALTMTGDNFIVHQNSTFSVGDPAASSIRVAAEVFITNIAQVEVAQVSAGAKVLVVNADAELHILGDFTQTGGGFFIEDGASFRAGGSFEHAGEAPDTMFVSGGSEFHVGQELRLSADTLTIHGFGSVGAAEGDLASTLEVGAGGSIVGDGTVIADVVVGGGSIEPGAPIGTVAVQGDYLQLAGGSLVIDIAGPGPDEGDLVAVTGGAATLGGTLRIALLDGFEPVWGDSWTAMTYPVAASDFALLDAPVLGSADLRWFGRKDPSSYAVGVRTTADTDGNGAVNSIDLNAVLASFGAVGASTPNNPFVAGDANEDGFVNSIDLNLVLAAFGSTAPR